MRGRADNPQELSGHVPIISRKNSSAVMSGKAVYFSWNKWRKPLAQGRLERHRSEKHRMSVGIATLHFVVHGFYLGCQCCMSLVFSLFFFCLFVCFKPSLMHKAIDTLVFRKV